MGWQFIREMESASIPDRHVGRERDDPEIFDTPEFLSIRSFPKGDSRLQRLGLIGAVASNKNPDDVASVLLSLRYVRVT